MASDRITITTWTDDETPSESELRQRLEGEGFVLRVWAKEPGHVSEMHTHSFNKVLYVVEGEMTYRFPELGKSVHLTAGDRIELAAYVAHNAIVGSRGVHCIEGAAPEAEQNTALLGY
jgi:quercetin dioxygenase-like cupin family protein